MANLGGPTTSKAKLRTATADAPSIESILNGYALDRDRAQLLKRVAGIKEAFVCAKPDGFDRDLGVITLWVKGYALTESEKLNGILGNYMTCHLECVDGLHRLRPERVERPGRHPQRIPAPAGSHPDGKAEIIKCARKRRPLPSRERAVGLLDDLQSNYSKVVIRATDRKAFAIIWERGAPKKVVFRVHYDPDGYWYIEMTDNVFQRPPVPEEEKRVRNQMNDLYNSNVLLFTTATLPERFRVD